MHMGGTIYCLVDASGKVYVKDGAESHADVAAGRELDEHACHAYRFDLTTRRLVTDRGGPASHRAVRSYLDRHIGTPDRLMAFAEARQLPKGALVNLLVGDERQAYLDACAVIEKKFTDDCIATKDPCLESGCAAEGEILPSTAVEGRERVSPGMRRRMDQAVCGSSQPHRGVEDRASTAGEDECRAERQDVHSYPSRVPGNARLAPDTGTGASALRR